MPSEPFLIVESELRSVVGEILAKGIMSQAMKKVGVTPDRADEACMRRACDTHIRQSMEAFLGRDGAGNLVMKIKKHLNSSAS